MSTIDLSSIAGLTVQINALQQSMGTVTDPGAKALIGAQITMLSAQLTAEVQHAQAQADASSNMLNSLGLFATLSQTVGAAAPAIIGLFKP
jgi:hypothetical protein